MSVSKKLSLIFEAWGTDLSLVSFKEDPWQIIVKVK